jgi:transposase-like protein
MYASTRRDTEAARRFFHRAATTAGVVPAEVITDGAPTYPRVLDEMWPAAWHRTEQYANNRIEADHAQLKRRLCAMRGIKTMTSLRLCLPPATRSCRSCAADYEIAADEPARRRLIVAFTDLARAI